METLDYKLDLEDRSVRERIKVGFIDFSIESLYLASKLVDAGLQLAILDLNDYFRYLTNYCAYDRETHRTIEYLKRSVKEGKISVSNNSSILKNSLFFFIFSSVYVNEKGVVEYSLLERSCKIVGDFIRGNSIVIFSTRIFPGTTENILRLYLENRSGMKASADFGLAYAAISTEGKPTILGALDKYTLDMTADLLRIATNKEVIKTESIRVAEAASLMEDIYHNVNLAFSNEVSELCEKLNLDFFEVKKILRNRGLYAVVNPAIIEESFSNVCRIFVNEAEFFNMKLRLSKLAARINEQTIKRVLNLIKAGLKICNKTVRRSKALIIGVPMGVHSTSPRLSITKSLYDLLNDKGMKVEIFTSKCSSGKVEDLGFKVQGNIKKGLKCKDCLILASKERAFSNLNLREVKHLVNQPALIVDLTNQLDPETVLKEGFIYISLGRGIRLK